MGLMSSIMHSDGCNVRQMYGRVQNYLDEQLKINVRSSDMDRHSAAGCFTHPTAHQWRRSVRDVTLLDWFNTKKRALLAPFGVGTIDRELGALNVRHSSPD